MTTHLQPGIAEQQNIDLFTINAAGTHVCAHVKHISTRTSNGHIGYMIRKEERGELRGRERESTRMHTQV